MGGLTKVGNSKKDLIRADSERDSWPKVVRAGLHH